MDPLSVTASIIAVATLAKATGRAFQDLRSLCKTLPGRLQALSNEVADIGSVLYHVASVFERRGNDPVLSNQALGIPELMRSATNKLEEVRRIVLSLVRQCQSGRVPLVGAYQWRKHQPRLQALQEDIKNTKCNINVLLGASNSQDMMRVRLDLKAVTLANSQSTQNQAAFQEFLQKDLIRHHEGFDRSLTQVYERIDQRIDTVVHLLETQSAQLEANQTNQLGDCYGPRYRQPPRRPVRRETQHHGINGSDDIAFRVNQYKSCRPGCSCLCHLEKRASTPGLVDRVLGQVFVGYTGLPSIGQKCSVDTCEKSQPPAMTFEYWFPLGFMWSQIVRLRLSYEQNLGPRFELSTLRRVPDSAQCVTFALDGNIDGLKDLFKQGLASPRDVSTTRGYSVLRWAMYAKQYQTCKFLVHAGADPDYRPIAASDNSPRNKAHQFLLMGGLADSEVDALRCLTQDSDFIDEQNYTLLHKIVLGLSMQSLEEALCSNPDLIDVPDAMGRTALAWAAARGDERSIVILLQHDAEVNTIDVQHSGIVGHAADRDHVTCVRLLLEAGADPDIAASYGHKVGNPLNVAARNASNPLVLKTLLDFGANIESCGIDGTTALIHAARKDNVSFATILLEYGANLNAVSTAGQTPLTTAVVFNSHNVLQLLLDRWFEYSECPRLKGPHLLQIVALYADIKTMEILTMTDHLVLSYDANYILGDFANRLNERPDVTEKLIKAFEELLSIINKGPEMYRSPESRMESGLASGLGSPRSPNQWTLGRTSTLGTDQDFLDALETLHDVPGRGGAEE
ncbi:MAG: hypothetical protein Q9213_001612 [Squamulea squamosa]